MQQRFLLKILLLAQHVSGTTTSMSIIRSSRVLYIGRCLWYFLLWFSSCWSGVELRVMGLVCRVLLYLFGHHYAHHQELKSTLQWLLPVVFGAVVFKLLVLCGAEVYVSGLQGAALPFRSPLCPSSGAQEYYTVVAACGIWCCGFQVAGQVWS